MRDRWHAAPLEAAVLDSKDRRVAWLGHGQARGQSTRRTFEETTEALALVALAPFMSDALETIETIAIHDNKTGRRAHALEEIESIARALVEKLPASPGAKGARE
jgi:hypothetical protein